MVASLWIFKSLGYNLVRSKFLNFYLPIISTFCATMCSQSSLNMTTCFPKFLCFEYSKSNTAWLELFATIVTAELNFFFKLASLVRDASFNFINFFNNTCYIFIYIYYLFCLAWLCISWIHFFHFHLSSRPKTTLPAVDLLVAPERLVRYGSLLMPQLMPQLMPPKKFEVKKDRYGSGGIRTADLSHSS